MKRLQVARNDLKKRIYRLLFFVCLAATVASGIVLLTDYVRIYREDQFWKSIRDLRDSGLDSADVWEPGNLLPEYQELYDRNSDMVGWLKIDGAKIDSPVMQTKEDPEYYLRRNFDREEDGGGTPFVDYRCSLFSRRSFNVIVYGHYTDGDRLFRRLLEYAYQNWGLEHRQFQFDLLTQRETYELVGCFYFDGTDAVLNEPQSNSGEQAYEIYNYIELDSKEGFERFAEELEKKSLYPTGIKITPQDQLLTIICCAPKPYSQIEENGRFAIVARQSNH